MRHARSDYEAIQPWPVKRPHIARDPEVGCIVTFDAPSIDERAILPLIPDDEPVFILRAKDVTAPEVVRYWAYLQEIENGDSVVAAVIRQWADKMETYGREHGAKMPDTPHEFLEL